MQRRLQHLYVYLAQGQNSNSILQQKYIYILPQPHYTNPLFALIYFANHTLSIISINTIAKSSVYWNKLDIKLDVKPNIRLSRGSTNTFLAFWKDDWPLAFETWTFFFIKNMHKLWMVFMYIANLKRKKKCEQSNFY